MSSLSALIDGLCVLLGGGFLGLAAAASGEKFVAVLAFLLLVGGLVLMVGSAFVTVPGA